MKKLIILLVILTSIQSSALASTKPTFTCRFSSNPTMNFFIKSESNSYVMIDGKKVPIDENWGQDRGSLVWSFSSNGNNYTFWNATGNLDNMGKSGKSDRCKRN